MKYLNAFLSFALAVAFLLPIASAASVTRTLSSQSVAPGGALTVTLSVDASGGDYYAIDEIYPAGWGVVDAGAGSVEHAGHWKYVIIEGAQDAQFTYTLMAPMAEGAYSFSGEYMFGGMESATPMAGQSSVTVASFSMDAVWMLLLVVIAGAAAALIILKKFRW